MFVWLISMALLVFLAVAIKPKDERSKKRFFIFAALILILLLGCRNGEINYGTDLNNYYRIYGRAMALEWDAFVDSTEGVELGYLAVNYLLAKVIPWQQFILFAQAIFCIGIYFRFLYKNTDNINIATICFVSFGSFQFFLTGFRQSIAICFGMLMFEAAKEKKILRYLLFWALAMMIHQTAIVLLPVYLLVNMKNTIGNNALVLVSSATLLFFSRELLELGMDAFDKTYGLSYTGNVLGGLVPSLIYIIIFILCFVNKPPTEPNKQYIGMVRMLIVGAITYLLRYEATIMERISMYFTITSVPLLTENIERFKPGFDRRLVKLICLVCCMGLYVWRVATQYTTYTFFWQ